jgi:hypothetical protein
MPHPDSRPPKRLSIAPTWRFLLLAAVCLLPARPAFAWKFTHTGVDSSAGQPGQFISMARAKSGRIHASYFRYSSDDGGKNLAYATKPSSTTGSWTFHTVDGGSQVGTYSSISLELNGNPHIAYYESEFANLKHAWYDSSMAAWRTELVDNIGVVGQFSSIAVDTLTGAVNILYYDATRPGLKWARKPAGGLWSFSYVDTTGVCGLYASALFSGILEVAYYDLQFGSLRYARQSGNGWVIESVDTPGDVGMFASMAPIGGRRGIAYYDATNHQLKYAENSGPNMWTKVPIDNVSNPGLGLSLAVGPARRPAIAYYAAGSMDLKYAERFRGTWVYDVIATGGDVGRYNGMVMDEVDLPTVLYFDATQGKLRAARGKGEATGVPDTPRDERQPGFLPVLTVRTNPFRDTCPLTLTLARPATVGIEVYDVSGRRLRRLDEAPLPAGASEFRWDGTDEAGQAVANGLYFLRVLSPAGPVTTRVTRLR